MKIKIKIIGYCILVNENYIKYYCKSVIKKFYFFNLYVFV